jgi:hypothetical protein
MTYRTVKFLHDAQQGHEVLLRLWTEVKPYLLAGHKLEVRVKPQSRTPDQNDKFHAMCRDFERSGILWMNKPRSETSWKVLLISGHAVATKEEAEVIPGLEGEFVNIRESSASMSKARGSSLIEYTQAMGDSMGVKWKEAKM